jgi:hypothetical protein
MMQFSYSPSLLHVPLILDSITHHVTVLITNLLVIPFSTSACYFVPLRSKYSSQKPALKHPQPLSFPYVEKSSFIPIFKNIPLWRDSERNVSQHSSNLICCSLFRRCNFDSFNVHTFSKDIFYIGARGSVVGWGTTLQAGRSRVRIPMRSLDFSIDIILSAALWPWGRLSL